MTIIKNKYLLYSRDRQKWKKGCRVYLWGISGPSLEYATICTYEFRGGRNGCINYCYTYGYRANNSCTTAIGRTPLLKKLKED